MGNNIAFYRGSLIESTLLVENALNHFCRRRKQVTFALIGALRVYKCKFSENTVMFFRKCMHVLAAQTTHKLFNNYE